MKIGDSILVGAWALIALTGCSKNVDTLDAVRQGVLRDIPKDVNVGAMDVNVVSVSFRGKEADAVVSFAPKGGAPMMSMNYTMEKRSGEWHIKSRAAGDLQKHAAQAPGAMSGGGGDGQLPPGHPPTGPGTDSGQALPPGHPPLNGQK